MKLRPKKQHADISPVCYRQGRIWYTKAIERRLFFILTLVMLVAGILFKVGVI